MNKVYYTESDLRGQLHNIIREMQKDNWRPDYIVGLTRGGLAPANMISQYMDIPMHTLNVSFRDADIGPESNLWMAEDAFGYVNYEGTEFPAPADRLLSDPALRKNILIVDDINDTGKTLDWIVGDWISSCMPSSDAWDTVWGNNVRMAVLVNNEASAFKDIDYCGETINKAETPVWCVFPWEEWWK